MKLSHRQKNDIADFAHQFSLDNQNGMRYPITDSWIYALVEVMKREGYEIRINKLDDVTNNSELLEWEYPSEDDRTSGIKRECFYNRR